MSTENTLDTTSTGGTSAESTSSSVDNSVSTTSVAAPAKADAAIATQAKVEGVASATAPVVPAPSAYTPNYKYKAALQEKELDPFFHALIKDAESEKKVKDVFTRADAFDYMKNRYEMRDKEFQTLNTDFSAQSQLVNRVREAQQKGDLDSVFRVMGMNDHQIIQWAAKRVDYLQMVNQLPPDQRQALQQQEQAVIQNQQYQDQLTQMQSDLQEQKVQARTMRLEQTLSRPEVSSAAQFWDTKMGQEGAFRDLVIEEAQKEWYTNQVDLTPEQAVQKVMQRFGKFIEAQGIQSQANMPTPNQPMAPQMPGQKPVIPVVPGSSKTPIKKQYKSIAELKQRAKELEAL